MDSFVVRTRSKTRRVDEVVKPLKIEEEVAVATSPVVAVTRPPAHEIPRDHLYSHLEYNPNPELNDVDRVLALFFDQNFVIPDTFDVDDKVSFYFVLEYLNGWTCCVHHYHDIHPI